MPSFFSSLMSDAKKLIDDPRVKEFTDSAKQAADFAKKQATDLANAAKSKTEEVLKELAPKTPKEILLDQLKKEIHGLEQFIAREEIIRTLRKKDKDNCIRASAAEHEIKRALSDAPDLIKIFKLCEHALNLEVSVDVLKEQEQKQDLLYTLENYTCISKQSLMNDATHPFFGDNQKRTTGLDLVNQSIKIAEDLSVKTANGKKQAEELLASPRSEGSQTSNTSPRTS